MTFKYYLVAIIFIIFYSCKIEKQYKQEIQSLSTIDIKYTQSLQNKVFPFSFYSTANNVNEENCEIILRKMQQNGIMILCNQYDAQYIYSNDTDTSYQLSTYKCYNIDNLPDGDICNDYEYNGSEFIKSSYNKLKDENRVLKAQVQTLSEQNSFLDECVMEMAGEVYK